MSIPISQKTGSEVSCRIFPWLLSEAEKRGVPASHLLEGVIYTEEHFYGKRNRIDWSTAHRIFANFGKHFNDDELFELGATGADQPTLRYVDTIARLLFTTSEFYRWSVDVLAPTHYTCMTITLVEIAPGHVLDEYEMHGGYEPSREFSLILFGQLTIYPVPLGLPKADVDMQITEGGARYNIKFIESGGALSRLRKLLTWPFTARTAGRELEAAHVLLLEHYTTLHNESQARIQAEASLNRIREDERERIRRELHDSLGQKVTGIGYIAKSLETKLLKAESSESKLARQIVVACQESLDELGNIVRGFGPVALRTDGLVESLKKLLVATSDTTGIDWNLENNSESPFANTNANMELYRIAQECISNSIKHAQPTAVKIIMSDSEDRFLMSISDDGSGPGIVERHGMGMGIQIMRKRAGLLNGEIRFAPAENGSTSVVCDIPANTLQEDENSWTLSEL